MAPEGSSDELLRVTGLHAGYGPISALSGVDLTVGRNEIVTLVGANGAGKTTLLRVLSGQVGASAGTVVLDGVPLGRLRPDQLVRRGVVHVPEGRQILSRLTVEENLVLGAYQRRRAEIADAVAAVCGRFEVLGQRRGQLAGTLSGGEQQMLAIGRALMADPRLLLLDEPSLGLAPLVVQRIFELIGELRAEGLTILLVEQNARQALRTADRAYLLETGRVVTSGPAAQLADDPRIHQAYLGGSGASVHD